MSGGVAEPRLFFRCLKTKLLFLCSRNQWRSPTAEALFKNHPRYEARSAGTENGARNKLTAGHVGWASARRACGSIAAAGRPRDGGAA